MSGQLKGTVNSLIPVVGQTETDSSEQWVTQRPQRPRTDVAPTTAATEGTQSAVVYPRHYLAQALGGLNVQDTSKDPTRLLDTNVGYQPVVGSVSYGALLQVTPTLVPDSEFVVLDLQNMVTLPASEPSQSVSYGGVMPLDRLNIVSQQFMTTLYVPLGTPTLVGGATLKPMSDDSSQLYLVIEVDVASGTR